MMNHLFPFGFPAPTAFYLVAYIVTLLIHFAFMAYVLGGSAYIALVRVQRVLRPTPKESGPIENMLIDWLPAMLSGAITAAIAPLLFLQILYQHNFYTANLLLLHRWMAILPILIIGFYVLYLLKSSYIAALPAWARVALAAVPFICFFFTGYTWMENHLLSLQTQDFWSAFYGTGRTFYYEPVMAARILVWAGLAWAATATIIAWQLWYRAKKPTNQEEPNLPNLARTALGGVIFCLLFGVLCLYLNPSLLNLLTSSRFSAPYFAIGIAGLGVYAASWRYIVRYKNTSILWLCSASAGLMLFALALLIVREGLRLQRLGGPLLQSLFANHALASQKGGFFVFLVFFVINAGLVTLCFTIVRRKEKI